ncbi:MAG: hypothetical protein PHU67_04320 [Sulfurovum sp.]|nr:hypothetical protein [Sulfurovum sp.]
MNNYNLCFATAFYHSEGEAPNIKKSADIQKKFDVYYQCIVVMFASLRRFYKEDRMVIFSDALLPNEYQDFLKYLHVETIVLEKKDIIYVNDLRIQNKFPGCLFTLDVFNYVASSKFNNDIDLFCLLDSDCIMSHKLAKYPEDLIEKNLIGGIEINYENDHIVNGQSKNTLHKIYNKLFSKETNIDNFKYFGGEMYMIPSKMIKNISDDVEFIFDYLTHQDKLKDNNEFTEEHILTLAFNKNEVYLTDNIIKRIWTADVHTNIDGTEKQYAIFHLPAEKKYFFQNMFMSLKLNKNAFFKISDDEYNEMVYKPVYNRINPTLIRRVKIIIKNTGIFFKTSLKKIITK